MEKEQATIERIKKVWTPDAKLNIPHQGKSIFFAYPSIGPNTYTEVGKQILRAGMKVPTGDYTASLLHSAYCDDSISNEPEFQNIREIMKQRWLWVFNRNLWAKDGVYILPDLEASGRSQPLDQKNLEKMLKGSKEINGVRFSKDGKVRFAEKGSYHLGSHTPESLAKDGFMIASYGIEGAEKLGEVSSKFTNKPYIYGVETETPELRVSALVVNRDIIRSLYVLGFNFVFNGNSSAFGVLK